MKISNTLSRKMEDVEPLEAGCVRMYTCGPTVYDYAHIGNYRAYIFEDILRRHLKWSGFDVVQVMNLTDVDDKTIRGANAAGVSLGDYTKKYSDAFFEDLKILNIERAEHYPAATGHISEMLDIIGVLEKKGFAYKSEDGSVYFNVERFPEYGRLARLDKGGMKAGARVAQDEYEKQNLADFALWKAWTPDDGDIFWDSPWGRGRPGWHIECSAMGMKYLGETFDLHTGGIDNMFPHHENEIAQSECATGRMFVKYWMHCAHLQVNGHKMSKSLGNFFTLRDLLEKGYTGREIRYVLLAGHYRQTLNFTFDALVSARASLARLDEFRSRLESLAATQGMVDGANPEWAEERRVAFRAALDDDLNMPEALGELFRLVHEANKRIDSGEMTAGESAGVLGMLADMDKVAGCFLQEEEKPDEKVLALMESRAKARKDKNWKLSDELRDHLAGLGWDVKDTPGGQKSKRK